MPGPVAEGGQKPTTGPGRTRPASTPNGTQSRNIVINYGHERFNQAYYSAQVLADARGMRGERDFTERSDDFVLALIASLGGKRLVSNDIRKALASVDTPEEREALRAAGKLETFGERTSRELYASLLYFFGSPDARKLLAKGKGSLQAKTPGFNPRGSLSSRILDLGYNFVDPTLGASKVVKGLTKVSDA